MVVPVGESLAGRHHDALPCVDTQRIHILHVTHLKTYVILLDLSLTIVKTFIIIGYSTPFYRYLKRGVRVLVREVTDFYIF
jgi:hypothetical protein